MAHSVNKFLILDGPSHVTLHCTLESDGDSPDLTNYVLLDPTTELVPQMPARQDLILKQIWYELNGLTVTFAFNALTPWTFWTLTPGASLRHDWRFFGGLRDRSSAVAGLDSTGELLISTQGLSTSTARGSFVLWLEKRDRANPQPD